MLTITCKFGWNVSPRVEYDYLSCFADPGAHKSEVTHDMWHQIWAFQKKTKYLFNKEN